MSPSAQRHAKGLIDALDADGMSVEESAAVLVAVAAGMVEESCGPTYRRQWEARLVTEIQNREQSE